LLKKIQECPYCHHELELDESEQAKKEFECPDCSKVIDFRDDFEGYRVNILPKIVECPRCQNQVELDEDEQVKKQFVCPYCRSSVDFTVKGADHV